MRETEPGVIPQLYAVKITSHDGEGGSLVNFTGTYLRIWCTSDSGK